MNLLKQLDIEDPTYGSQDRKCCGDEAEIL
jgi:hypothetical protein